MENLIFRQATENDIDAIAGLAHEIWNEYYPAIIGQEQVDYMLNRMYSAEGLMEQMLDKGHVFYLVGNATGDIGFYSFSIQQNEAILHKLYILKENRASGTATEVMNHAIAQLESKGVNTLRLTVNRMNTRAINFYFKTGFKIERAADFDIGGGYYMNDFVMIKRI